MGKRKYHPPYRLMEEGGAARRQVQYNIRASLDARRKKYFNDNAEIEEFARKTWDMSEHYLKGKDQGGYPNLRQAIRNALKWQKSDGPDLLTRGLLIALEDGGAALPGCIPTGRKAKDIPRSDLGFDPPRIQTTTEKKDWTKAELGTSREPLKKRLAEALLAIDSETPAHIVDAHCGYIEAAIRNFRDNER